MKTASRTIALAAVAALALTACVRVEVNVELQEDDVASGEMIFALSQDVLAIAGEDGLDELLAEQEDIEGATTERYESEDLNDAGQPNFVGSRTVFTDLPITDFQAPGEDINIVRDGDEYVVTGAASTLDEELTGMDGSMGATVAMSVTFPGEVTSHNGQLDGTTVTWDLLTHADDIQARGSATADSGFPLWLIITIIALAGVGIGIAVVLVTSAKRKPTDESAPVNQAAGNTGMQGTADAGASTVPIPAEPVVATEQVVDTTADDGTADDGTATHNAVTDDDEPGRA